MQSQFTRICQFCGTEFRPTHSCKPNKYCSQPCSAKGRPVERLSHFWEDMDRSGGPDACWPWTKAKFDSGYGYTRVNGRGVGTHRVAWELTNGPIPDGLLVRHFVCDNPPCCNPAHLRLGTIRDNAYDAMAKGRLAVRERHSSRTHPERRPRGESHGRAKLTDADVRAIRVLLAQGVPGLHIARRFGVDHHTVYNIRDGRNWAHVQ